VWLDRNTRGVYNFVCFWEGGGLTEGMGATPRREG